MGREEESSEAYRFRNRLDEQRNGEWVRLEGEEKRKRMKGREKEGEIEINRENERDEGGKRAHKSMSLLDDDL